MLHMLHIGFKQFLRQELPHATLNNLYTALLTVSRPIDDPENSQNNSVKARPSMNKEY
jgi:hypothetical protein